MVVMFRYALRTSGVWLNITVEFMAAAGRLVMVALDTVAESVIVPVKPVEEILTWLSMLFCPRSIGAGAPAVTLIVNPCTVTLRAE